MWFSHRAETTATPRRVWDVWTDVERWPTWDPELRDASVDGAFAVGNGGTVRFRRGPAVPFVVTELDPVRSCAYVLDVPLGRVGFRRSLHGHDGGTAFTHEVWFEGLLGGLLSRTLGRRYRRSLPRTVDAVRERAEATPATGSSSDTAYR